MRGRPRKLTDHDFLELYHEGLSDVVIAEIMDVDPQTVWSRRHQLGLPVNPCCRRTAMKLVVYDAKTGDYIMEGTVPEIAARLGLSKNTVYNYRRCTKNGAPCRYEVHDL